MEKFDLRWLHSKNGRLDTFLFKNSFLNLPATLYYQIRVDLERFEVEGTIVDASIYLNLIKIDKFRLEELESRTVHFPVNPVEGYIDGSVYLFDVHIPVDVKQIDFLTFNDNSIDAVLYFDIDFEYENTGYKKLEDCRLEVNLKPGQLLVDPESATEQGNSPAAIQAFISTFTDLSDYEDGVEMGGEIRFNMQHWTGK